MEKTKYQVLMEMSESCTIEAAKARDVRVARFYFNAANGFKNKAGKLTLAAAISTK